MTPAQNVGQTKIQSKDAARIVDRSLSYARLQLKQGIHCNAVLESRCFIHACLYYVNSALLSYGAELALPRKLPLIESDSWLLYTRYKEAVGVKEGIGVEGIGVKEDAVEHSSDPMLAELVGLEADADSWLCQLESLCVQLTLNSALTALKPDLRSELLRAGSPNKHLPSDNLSNTIVSSSNIDIYNDVVKLTEVLEQALVSLDLLIERHRNLSAEF